MKRILCLIASLCLILSGFLTLAKMPEEAEARQTESAAEADSIREAGAFSGEMTASASDAESALPEERKRKICLDASLTGPPNVEEVWFAAHRSTDGRKCGADLAGKMRREVPVTKGENTWNAVFAAEIPEQYDEIRFSTEKLENSEEGVISGNTTGLLDIPKEAADPCFYPDADDPSSYEGSERGGYWGETFEIRDPEAEYMEKLQNGSGEGISEDGLTEIPERPDGTDQNILYLTSDLYDYYTDFELNGIPRSDFTETEKSDRTWVPFRNLDEALSDAYRINGGIPLYVGHFQPDAFEELRFSEIAPLLNLTGWDDRNGFFSTNNSTLDASGNGSAEARKYSCASQGLIGKELVNGYPVCRERESLGDTDSFFPLFSENFLEGKNSRNVKLGRVYHNAAFPFRQVDRDEDGILYWSFDSAKNHIHLTRPADAGEDNYEWYFSDYPIPGKSRRKRYLWSKNMTSAGEPDPNGTSDQYGFFPLNSPKLNGNGYAYNFGFGLRMAFDFHLPKDGVLKDKNGKNKPVVFSFSGDDDLWVFVDGKLVLDVGGDHGKVEGIINFADDTASVSRVKRSQGDPDAKEGLCTTKFELADTGEKHQLVLFYMERGMWESNLKLQFNMAPEKAERTEEMELPNTGEGGMSELYLAIGTGLLLSSIWIVISRGRKVRLRLPIRMMPALLIIPLLATLCIKAQAAPMEQTGCSAEDTDDQKGCESWTDPLTATAELKIDFPAKTDFYAVGVSDGELEKLGISGSDVPVGKLADAAVKLSDSLTDRQKEMIRADGMTIRGLVFGKTYLITGHTVETDEGKVTPLPFFVRPTRDERTITAEVKYTLERTSKKINPTDQKPEKNRATEQKPEKNRATEQKPEKNRPTEQKPEKNRPDSTTSVRLKKKDGKVTLEPAETGDVNLKEIGITILSAFILGLAVIIRKKIQ